MRGGSPASLVSRYSIGVTSRTAFQGSIDNKLGQLTTFKAHEQWPILMAKSQGGSMGRAVWVFLVIAITASALAAPARKPPTRVSSVEQSKAAEEAFDPTTYSATVDSVTCSNVPSRYKTLLPTGLIMRRLVATYESGPRARDEFETTYAYSQRLGEMYSAALGGTYRVVAVLPVSKFMTYNADTTELTIEPFRSSSDRRGFGSVEIGSELRDTGRYVGQNAFGATASVTRRIFTQYYLSMPIPSAGLFSSPMIKDKLLPDSARALKQTGALVIVGTIISPYVQVESRHSSATIGDPSDTTYLIYDLTINAECALIVVNGKEIGRLRL